MVHATAVTLHYWKSTFVLKNRNKQMNATAAPSRRAGQWKTLWLSWATGKDTPQRQRRKALNLISFFRMVNSGFKLWSLDNKLDSESKSFTGTNVMCHTDIRWLGGPQSGHISHFTKLSTFCIKTTGFFCCCCFSFFWHSDVIAMTVKHSSLILINAIHL